MIRYILKRLLVAIPTFLLIVTAAFFLMRVAPGGPFDKERTLPPEIEKNILAAYNLDKPLIVQYTDYLGGLIQFDFGPSYSSKDFTVTELLMNGFPASLTVGGLALCVALFIGISFGILAALRQNSWIDYLVMSCAMTGIAIPNFVMAPLLTLILGVYVSWLPVAGWGNGQFSHLLLPVITLALPQVGAFSRLMRASLIEVLNAHFIRTARAKGLREQLVILRHALRPALIPVLSYMGPAALALLTGSVVIESIFDIPGIGRYFVNGALNRDYPLVLGVVILYAGLIIILNLFVDLLYAVMDPKVRESQK